MKSDVKAEPVGVRYEMNTCLPVCTLVYLAFCRDVKMPRNSTKNKKLLDDFLSFIDDSQATIAGRSFHKGGGSDMLAPRSEKSKSLCEQQYSSKCRM